VANPKCGTCRFFQPNDLPGSGWCHHPQRKVSSDVKILVRRSELACRDDWSRSLWQPATGESGAGMDISPPASSGPLLPASQESLRAILNRDLTGSGAPAAPAGEDVLLSEARIVSEREEPWQPSARPFPAGSFDPRTALFKAREAYREKIRANAMASRQSAVEGNPGAFDRAESESVRPATTTPETGRSAAVWNDDPQREREPESATAASMAVAAPILDWSEEPEPELDASFWGANELDRDEESLVDYGTEAEVCAPDVPAIIEQDASSLEAQPAMLVAALPGWFRVDLPRVCRACRDFRPATDGQRGWCANTWAFTHRQLVQEDDVTPCHSAIGDWWVPVDDVWLVAADVSSHGRATPLLDRMIAEESGQRRRS
jgi:hypothetical protein